MKRSLLIAFVVFSQYLMVSAQSVTTFILIRHAEKVLDDSADPSLKPEGEARAEKLVAMLEKTNISAIYSTNLKRTRNTVTPLAMAKGLNIKVYEPFKETPIEQMLKDHPGGTVLISGHSNNIPWIANLLTGRKDFEDFADDDYGNVLIVDVVSKGKVAKVTRLRY